MPDEAKKKKHYENVGKHLEKGNAERAIKELGKLLELDPNEVKARLKLGDLHAKRGARAEAIEAWTAAAEAYEGQARLLEASAVYKQILRLDNGSVETHETLASLCARLGLNTDAVSHYHIAAQLCDAKGDSQRSLQLLKTVARLDPQDVLARKKISEMVARDSGADDAMAEMERLAEDLRRKGKREELVKVLEKMGHLAPENTVVMLELASLYLEAGDGKKALARLQVCFREDPTNLETLELLAAVFHSLGRPEKAESVTQEIDRLRHG
jgi:pilus assembly protein FimV